jgi:hypothetical protein
MWKKSQANRVSACARRKVRQVWSVLRMGAGWQSMAPQGLADRGGRYLMPQTPQLTLNPRIPPRRVLLSQANDQLDEILADRRAPRCSGLSPPAGDQALVPAQHRARSDEPVRTYQSGQ